MAAPQQLNQPDMNIGSMIASRYKQTGHNEYIGPQGDLLADFLELHCPDANVRNCYLGVEKRHQMTNRSKRHLLAQVGGSVSQGAAQSFTECFVLTDLGQEELKKGAGNTLVYALKLRCLGGFFRGDDTGSGANCQKDSKGGTGWCSNLGNVQCLPETCGYARMLQSHSPDCPSVSSTSDEVPDANKSKKCNKSCLYHKSKSKQRRNTILHGCSFGVDIIATIRNIDEGLRTIRIFGQHVPAGIEWIPPNVSRICQRSRSMIKKANTLGSQISLTQKVELVHNEATSNDISLSSKKELISNKSISRLCTYLQAKNQTSQVLSSPLTSAGLIAPKDQSHQSEQLDRFSLDSLQTMEEPTGFSCVHGNENAIVYKRPRVDDGNERETSSFSNQFTNQNNQEGDKERRDEPQDLDFMRQSESDCVRLAGEDSEAVAS